MQNAETEQRFAREDVTPLLKGVIAPALWEAGLICRIDDRGDPVIQLAPPLIAGASELDEITDILRRVLTDASRTVNA